MENMPLVIFSGCMQAAIGIMFFVAIAKLFNKKGIYKTAVLGAGILAIIGLLASFLHLGRPLHAANAILHFGTSWLSREIWFSSIFAALTVITALLILFKPSVKNAINVLIPITALIGIVDVYVMASIYYFASVPAWNYGAVYVEFYAFAISTGAMIFYALSFKDAANVQKMIAYVTAGIVTIQVVAMICYYVSLGDNSSLAAQQSISLLNNMDYAMVIKWLFILVGTAIPFVSIWEKRLRGPAMAETAKEVAAAVDTNNRASVLYLAVALLVIGQFVGRYIFYAIMVGTGVGLV